MANEVYATSTARYANFAVVTPGLPPVRASSVSLQTSRARVELPVVVFAASLASSIATADVVAASSAAPSAWDAVREVLRLWQCGCGPEDASSCVQLDALNILNTAIQFIHTNGRELPYLGRRTRHYFHPESMSTQGSQIRLESDVQSVDGYVRKIAPWGAYRARLTGAMQSTTPAPVGFNPFAAGSSVALTIDGDYYRVTFPQDGNGNAETLRRAIQAAIINDARVFVTFKPGDYFSISFDAAPMFRAVETNPIPARPWIVEIDFTTVNMADLRGTGFMLREAGGDDDLFWYRFDTVGDAPPGQGDFGPGPLDIYTGDLPQTVAELTKVAVDTFGPDYSAVRSGNKVTITAGYNSPLPFILETLPKAPLTFTTVQTGSSGAVQTVESFGGDNGMALIDSNGHVIIALENPEASTAFPYGSTAALIPLQSRQEFDNYVAIYGANAPQAYYLDRQHKAGSNSADIYMQFTPPLTDCMISVELQVSAPRFGWADVRSRAAIPLPHEYVESLFFPVLRYLASSSHRYVQRERHAAMMEQYKTALSSLGIVDPQVSAVKDGKEAEAP